MDEKQEHFGKWYAKQRQENGIDYAIEAPVYPLDYTEAVILKGYSHDQYVVRFGELGARPYYSQYLLDLAVKLDYMAKN